MKSSTSPPIDTTALRASLSPLLSILDAFNHRHKNQHRSSHWWSHFNILRRSLRALVSCPNRQDVVLPRVRWLKGRIVPRAYVPFTQLVADNQYAPLGLLLVSLLANIHTIANEALPDEDTSHLETLEMKTMTAAEVEMDKGTAISRGDFSQAKSPSNRSKAQNLEYVGPKPVVETREASVPLRKKKLVEVDESAAPAKKKKKKSKTKGADDFSSMFGSL